MMKTISLILAFILVLFFTFSGCSKPDPDAEYNKNASKGLEFTSNGDDTCYVSGIGTCSDENVVIPTVSPDGDKVKSIGEKAFENCAALKNVTIPHSVEFIGYDAFLGTSFYNDNSNWENGVLYADKYLIKAKDELSGTYDIKPGTVSIASEAFSNCPNLEIIKVPADVLYVDPYSFGSREDDNLKINLLGGEKQLKSILNAMRVQINRTVIVTITDPENSDSGNSAENRISIHSFPKAAADGKIKVGKTYRYYDLMTIVFPDFDMRGPYSLKIDHFLNNFMRRAFFVESDGKTVFDVLSNIKYVSNGDGTCCFSEVKQSDIKNVYITESPLGDTVTKIGASALENFHSLMHVTISSTVTTIESRAFAGCSELRIIMFEGTAEEWKKIEKGDGWNSSTGDFEVRCYDGVILTKAES